MSNIRIEGSKAYFDYSGVGAKTNETYLGEFCVKCILSPLDYLKSDRLYRELIGNINPHLASKEAQNYAFALSQLKYRVVGEIPEFFKNKELNGGHLDPNVLIEIVNLAIEAEEVYQEQQQQKIREMQEMLASRIKSREIVPEEEDIKEINDIEGLEDIPEIDLGE